LINFITLEETRLILDKCDADTRLGTLTWDKLIVKVSEVQPQFVTKRYKPSMNQVAFDSVLVEMQVLNEAHAHIKLLNKQINDLQRDLKAAKLKRQQNSKPDNTRNNSGKGKPCPECLRDLKRHLYHTICNPKMRKAAMEKAKARDKGEGKKPAPSPGPAKSYKDKTLSHGDAKNQCPHCKDDVPARASLHLDRYPSSKCLSRPDGPLQGLTGKDRVS